MARSERPNITPNRIREVRVEKGMSQEQLGDAIGVHFTTIAKLERSQRTLSLDFMAAIAKALGVPPSDLIVGAQHSPPASRMIPVLGKIAAGNWQDAIEHASAHIPAPPGAGPNAFALEPQGDSMDMVFAPDATIVVDPDDREPLDGKIYAIMNEEQETTVKRYRAQPPRFEPCSTNPDHKPIVVGDDMFKIVGRVIWQMMPV